MRLKFFFICSLFLLSLCFIAPLYAQTKQEGAQEISDFSLAGYGEKGKKSWDIAGKSANILNDIVKLDDITGNLYGEDDVKLTADKGDFDKSQAKVHLQDNVVITTASGAKLTTDSLDWDRKKQEVKTSDPVNIQRDNITTTGVGALGEPSLKKVTLNKQVKVDIDAEQNPKAGAPQEKVVITCDGPLTIDYEKNIAVFNNNVKVVRQDSVIYSDTMDVYFIANSGNKGKINTAGNAALGSKIDKIISRGNVKVVRGENVSYSDEAVYTAADKKIVLSGRPRLEIYSSEDLDASFGN
ncbi:MAG: LPS export ABC transporter periplasmic protein LptC [Candidatus Omnitrophota bacterium]|jgi:LPS export ABC transporter protein LptC|nr:MAG: LPS export ABC transporter periplasmic protein LptC [Candidatus Omnitrophota bacterium]